ncbi:hypothetical protein PIB30_044919 [Stylosanthes scabra]|uniref:Uncharacterized protein n=1 Tax=Stylosanthes scabra TaxID=79078 RepID=A0ABU6XGA5_9FABA|nr:hypothetical protein [Stylosanthes scabra]
MKTGPEITHHSSSTNDTLTHNPQTQSPPRHRRLPPSPVRRFLCLLPLPKIGLSQPVPITSIRRPLVTVASFLLSRPFTVSASFLCQSPSPYRLPPSPSAVSPSPVTKCRGDAFHRAVSNSPASPHQAASASPRFVVVSRLSQLRATCQVPSPGRELTCRLSSCNPMTTRNKLEHGSLRANVMNPSKRPIPPFWVLFALPLRILKDGEDPVTIAKAIVEEAASLVGHG